MKEVLLMVVAEKHAGCHVCVSCCASPLLLLSHYRHLQKVESEEVLRQADVAPFKICASILGKLACSYSQAKPQKGR